MRDDPTGRRLAPELEARMAKASRQPARVRVVVTLAEPAHEGTLGALAAGPAILTAPLRPTARWSRAIAGFAAELAPADIRRLAAHPLVRRVELDRPVQAHSRAALSWAGITPAQDAFGVSGDLDGAPGLYSTADVVIAMLDTGIDPGHADLAGKVVGWHDVIGGRPEPYDDNGHGTWTASIAAGAGVADPAARGAAYGAALVGIKVLDASGSGTLSGVISGVEWMLENREALNIRVANLSLGTPGPSDGRDALCRALDTAVDAGIVVCVSAGNSGPGLRSVGSPGTAAKVITVGGLYDPGDQGWVLAEFSSRGPTADGRVKPDICLPGVNITGAQAGTVDGYVTWSGTSASAPCASGLAAVMLSANRDLTPAAVKRLMTAVPCVRPFGSRRPNVDFGHGIARGFQAVAAAGGWEGHWSDRLRLLHGSGTLRRRATQTWRFGVTDTASPVGVTFIMSNWAGSQACDLFLYNPRGKLVASATGTARQEQIRYTPAMKGTYALVVLARRGSASYSFDLSFR